jgi:hypothetical protein
MSVSALVVCASLLISTLYIPSCGRRDTEVVFYVYDGYTFTQQERRAIETIAEAAARDARALLPDLPPHLIVRVNPGRKVIEELGSNSSYSLPNVVYWTVDPSRPGGAIGIARTHLRSTLFYQLHNLSRATHLPSTALMDHVVSTGMAAAFERDAGQQSYPWSEYPQDVGAWVEELRALPEKADFNPWMSRHPDGRRWIGMRAGVYLTDRAKKASGKSAAELITLSTEEVLRLALTE